MLKTNSKNWENFPFEILNVMSVKGIQLHNLDQELDVPIAKRPCVTSQRSRRTVKSRNKGVKSNNGPDISVEALQLINLAHYWI